MTKQIAEKDEGTSKLTDNLSEQLSTHEEDMKKQIEIYKEKKMTPYEMMLSESQERMLLIINSEKIESAKKIFVK